MLWLLAVPVLAAVTLSPAASYLVRTATALVASYVLIRAARRHRDGLGRARALFAASLLTGAVSGLSSAAYVVSVGQPPATGWLADWIYLAYAPCAVLGTLALPRTARTTGGRLRALADGAVAVGSLWYLSMVLLIDAHHLGDNLHGSARLISLAYPLVPAFIVAVMLSALPRVEVRARPFLIRGVIGIALLGISDAAFRWSTGRAPTTRRRGSQSLNELGLLFILAAALVGSRQVAEAGERDESGADVDATSGLLVVGAPYAPLVLGLLAVLDQFAHGRGIPPSQVPPLLLVGVAILVRHVASTRETGRLVSGIMARERAARIQAMTDPLTGLDNRSAFLGALDRALQDPRNHPVAVALLDLNDFKDINDTHGHDTGDEVLRHTADRLRHAVRRRRRRPARRRRVRRVRAAGRCRRGPSLADEIVDAFSDPMRIGKRFFQIRASVGIVLDERAAGASQRGDAMHLLAHADVAMYEAKTSKSLHDVPVAVLTGGARAVCGGDHPDPRRGEHADLGQFRLEYQPIVDLQTGEISGGGGAAALAAPGVRRDQPRDVHPARRAGGQHHHARRTRARTSPSTTSRHGPRPVTTSTSASTCHRGS